MGGRQEGGVRAEGVVILADWPGEKGGVSIWLLGWILTPLPRSNGPDLATQICTSDFTDADPSSCIGLGEISPYPEVSSSSCLISIGCSVGQSACLL